jgi:hypothetical protein
VRVPGGQPLISFVQNRFVPVALDVDGDRVLVARDGAVDVVLSENGGTVFHLDVPADPSLQPDQHKPPEAQLDGPSVAVRDGDNVDVYAVNGGALLHTWPLPDQPSSGLERFVGPDGRSRTSARRRCSLATHRGPRAREESRANTAERAQRMLARPASAGLGTNSM